MSSARSTPLQSLSVPSRPMVGSALRSANASILKRRREGQWAPGQIGHAGPSMHSEIFAGTHDASGAGFALALACDMLDAMKATQAEDPLAEVEDNRQILWVQDAAAIRRTGRPYRKGLPAELRDRLIHVATKSSEEALFALEEGLRCHDLAFVIGEVSGNPRSLDFTASRRLSLTAEKHGVPLWLVRLDAEPELSSARMRWRVSATQSLPTSWNASAPGKPVWHAELFRARGHIPGEWTIDHANGCLSAKRPTLPAAANTAECSAAHPGNLARPTVGRSLAAL